MGQHHGTNSELTQSLLGELGERFTGMDNGEQDGRWAGRYANQALRGRGGGPAARVRCKALSGRASASH